MDFVSLACEEAAGEGIHDGTTWSQELFYCSAVPDYVYSYFMFDSGQFIIGILSTVIILNIGTDRSEQTVQTQIRLLLMEQSDQGLLCLLFCLHLLNTILHCKIQLFQL